jgi:hypothetical protein
MDSAVAPWTWLGGINQMEEVAAAKRDLKGCIIHASNMQNKPHSEKHSIFSFCRQTEGRMLVLVPSFSGPLALSLALCSLSSHPLIAAAAAEGDISTLAGLASSSAPQMEWAPMPSLIVPME